MNGPIAQAVALTCHANARLSHRASASFFPQNSTCQFCRSVSFVAVEPQSGGKPRELPVASSPDEWFSLLEKERATGVELHHGPGQSQGAPERKLAGFVGGGGEYSLTVLGPEESTLWMARWQVGDRRAPDKRIWEVTYGRVASVRPAPLVPTDLASPAHRLETALVDIIAFAEGHALEGFARLFRQALACLREPGAEHDVYHRDLAPAGVLPAAASALLGACQSAWVFGGMGSWNDMGFDGQDGVEYDRVSESLYAALVNAIPAAANASLSSTA